MLTRFAPSPTGFLHLGHAFSALSVWEMARAAQGKVLLRIDDIDAGRCRPEYDAAIPEDLAFLGLDWDAAVLRQSTAMHIYAEALARLIQRGVVYRCFKTRKDLAIAAASAPHGADPIFVGGPDPNETALLAQGASFAWRLSLARAQESLPARALDFECDGVIMRATPEALGDVILARKDFPASYHLASVCDDARSGVTHVIRGEDLAPAAHLHVLLQALLDFPTPRYIHHRLIFGLDGKRLSKRNQAPSLRSLRAQGQTATDIRAQLGFQ